jgi:hypothetical protein
MKRHGFRGINDVYLDECYRCGGMFFGAGKLEAARDALMRSEIQMHMEKDRLRYSKELQAALQLLETTPGKGQGRLSQVFLKPRSPNLRKFTLIFSGSLALLWFVSLFFMRAC